MSQVLGLSLLLLLSPENLKIFQKSENLSKIWNISKNLPKIWKSEIFPKNWNFSNNLKIFKKSENLKILWKSEIFPKNWKISKNLNIFQKSENLKIWWKSENFPKICLIKCLKGHKSLGSLCSVVKTLIVSGAQARDRQWVLLSCCGQLKMVNFTPLW